MQQLTTINVGYRPRTDIDCCPKCGGIDADARWRTRRASAQAGSGSGVPATFDYPLELKCRNDQARWSVTWTFDAREVIPREFHAKDNQS